LVSDGKKPYYFDSVIRKKIIKGELKYEQDSHTSIADYYGFKGKKEDSLNKYEYNPLIKVFIIDQLNTVDDSKQIKEFCDNLDFTTIVPELIIKPIVNPFKDIKTLEVTKQDIKLLKEWDSVWDSVRDSVWDSVRDSVWDSVRDSVRNSVWVSVRDSVWVYISSFFNIKYKYDFSSAIKLWEKGLVPSFDGKIWRLHGENGKIVWKGKI
jgi:hypothetical protein